MYQHQEPTQAQIEGEYHKQGIGIETLLDDAYNDAVIEVTNHPYFRAFTHSCIRGNIRFGDLALRLIAEDTNIPPRVVRDIAIDQVRWDHTRTINHIN